MIDVRISKNGIERYEITGTAADVVAEFGIMINQYCSAVKKCCPQILSGLPGLFTALTAPESPVWKLDENVEGIFVSKKVGK